MTALLAHPTLPGIFRNLANPTAQALGALGEQLVFRILESKGYTVSNVHSGERRGDLRAVTPNGEIMRVEVKTARQTKDGKYHFSLLKEGKRDHRDSDLIIFLCVTRAGFVVPFVIPTSVLSNHKATSICGDPYHYNGKYRPYRQRLYALELEVKP